MPVMNGQNGNRGSKKEAVMGGRIIGCALAGAACLERAARRLTF
jgi:hypothetical protein